MVHVTRAGPARRWPQGRTGPGTSAKPFVNRGSRTSVAAGPAGQGWVMGKLSGEDIRRLSTLLSGTLSINDLESFVYASTGDRLFV